MTKLVKIGVFEDYVGVRGYPKKRAMLSLVDENGSEDVIGYVKIENVLSADGNISMAVIYPRFFMKNLWVKGTPYFFTGPRALVEFLQKRVDQLDSAGMLGSIGDGGLPVMGTGDGEFVEDLDIASAAAMAAGIDAAPKSAEETSAA